MCGRVGSKDAAYKQDNRDQAGEPEDDRKNPALNRHVDISFLAGRKTLPGSRFAGFSANNHPGHSSCFKIWAPFTRI
jgi:hypothetical protein